MAPGDTAPPVTPYPWDQWLKPENWTPHAGGLIPPAAQDAPLA